ncbi:MAG: Arc family DNA-binding protein [Sphaerochaetaceae bacterium]|nr:Arc family DNA-binding protein [Sphaerochaetaceae bacterium]
MEGKTPKKQIPLRLSESLFNELSSWAEDDFRSLNSQIEYLLTEAVRSRRKKRFKDEQL